MRSDTFVACAYRTAAEVASIRAILDIVTRLCSSMTGTDHQQFVQPSSAGSCSVDRRWDVSMVIPLTRWSIIDCVARRLIDKKIHRPSIVIGAWIVLAAAVAAEAAAINDCDNRRRGTNYLYRERWRRLVSPRRAARSRRSGMTIDAGDAAGRRLHENRHRSPGKRLSCVGQCSPALSVAAAAHPYRAVILCYTSRVEIK